MREGAVTSMIIHESISIPMKKLLCFVELFMSLDLNFCICNLRSFCRRQTRIFAEPFIS
jgi:hypothetical protein